MTEQSSPPRWGRDIEVTTALGYPCRMYTPRPRALAELLLDARRWRGREFIVQGEQRLSFEAFEAAVAGAAQRLREAGLGQGGRVFLHGNNRVGWLLGFWAAQVLGAATVLGNTFWSDGETEAALDKARPGLVVTDRAPDEALFQGRRVVGFDALEAEIGAGDGAELPSCDVDGEDLAIVMFSSGTMGAATGVKMTHRGVIANIHNVLALTGRLPDELPNDLTKGGQGTVSLLASPLFHLAGIQIQINTLLTGGKLVFLDGRFEPAGALRVIERERVRVWGGIPAMVARVIDAPGFADFDTSSVASISMGGAAITQELRDKIAAAFPATAKRVGSLYGCTEAGGVLAAGSGRDTDGKPGCVGRALPVVELRIDKPDGEGVGEIVARTPTLTAGFLGDDTPPADAEGWVRSGDLGRLDGDGFLYVVGRSKDIIIRGGENIAAGHVEKQLLSHPDVLEAAVVAVPDDELGEEVGARLVLAAPDAVTEADLADYLSGRLGRFEIPTHWRFGTEPLPLNPSGKVDKGRIVAEWDGSADG